jgi:hypothetical protein
MIREDRELLAKLARLNAAMAPLAMLIMEGSASASAQQHSTQRLITARKRVQRRAEGMCAAVVDDEVLASGSLTLPTHTVAPYFES